jgi:hypothetical protein
LVHAGEHDKVSVKVLKEERMMTVLNVQQLQVADTKWAQANTTYRTINPQTVQIDVPLLDPFSDEISIYVVAQDAGQLLITDDGWTLSNLADLGVDFQAENGALLKQQLQLHQIHEKDQALQILASQTDFPMAKNRLLQTILSLNTLLMPRS